jgi:peptide/nickel transport system permease protein
LPSPSQLTWQRFKRNRLALLCLWGIGVLLFLAVFGYRIIPDGTPNANRQIPEIALQGLGFSADFLPIYLTKKNEPVSIVQSALSGTPDSVSFLPIDKKSVKIIGDSIEISVFQAVNDYQKTKLLTKNVDYSHIVNKFFLLGTDQFGRDILSRLVIGLRVSLSVGFFAVLISILLGLGLGAVAGYFGGLTDRIIGLVMNVLWAIPTLLLVFALVLAFGRGFPQLFFAIGLTMWVDVARMVRGEVLAQRGLQYVEAAQGLGFGHFRILLHHILPNTMSSVLVLSAANFAQAILVESGLSYLGFGIQPPAPSWGTLLSENYGLLISDNPYPALAPALAIVLVVLAFYIIGNALRDALDVKN